MTDKSETTKSEILHKSVLLKETVDALNVQQQADGVSAIIVDATINGGGHSEELIRRYGSAVQIIGIDLDEDALARAQTRLAAANEQSERNGNGIAKFSLHQLSFRKLDEVIAKEFMELAGKSDMKIDGIIFDLGLSSNQLENSGKDSLSKRMSR